MAALIAPPKADPLVAVSPEKEPPSQPRTAAIEPLPGTRAANGTIGLAGRKLAAHLSRPYVKAGQERLAAAFEDEPTVTGILVGGAALMGLGAWVGYEATTSGRVDAAQSFELGTVGLAVSGGYDFAARSWSGLVRVDLSRILDDRGVEKVLRRASSLVVFEDPYHAAARARTGAPALQRAP